MRSQEADIEAQQTTALDVWAGLPLDAACEVARLLDKTSIHSLRLVNRFWLRAVRSHTTRICLRNISYERLQREALYSRLADFPSLAFVTISVPAEKAIHLAEVVEALRQVASVHSLELTIDPPTAGFPAEVLQELSQDHVLDGPDLDSQAAVATSSGSRCALGSTALGPPASVKAALTHSKQAWPQLATDGLRAVTQGCPIDQSPLYHLKGLRALTIKAVAAGMQPCLSPVCSCRSAWAEELDGREQLALQSLTESGKWLGALFGIMAVSTVGIALPYVFNTRRWATPLFLAKVFAAGVVVATAMAHVLPDAIDVLAEPCLGLSSSYPWATVIAGAAALLTFTVEHGLRKMLDRYYRKRMAESAAPQADSEMGSGLGTVAYEKALANAQNSTVAIVLETGVVFHSIFIGLGLGISTDAAVVRPLMIALMFHQGFEGLALGTVFVKARYSSVKYWIAAVVFLLITPIGIAIGIGARSSYSETGKAELGIQGAFDAISAGILLYNGLVDLIIPAFSAEELPEKTIWQLLGLVLLFAGYVCMSLLAKWA
ncbi:hypothetical protein WJX72_005078 [[Myrmecia] bisecta]|uniref:Uncharacterized protein n=1 Tax=[Myrmecia] bisecta TaxID=41462 RepID=A0AAW1Q934_9CHLO